MTTSARSAVAVAGTPETIRASAGWLRTTCALLTGPNRNGSWAAVPAVVSGCIRRDSGVHTNHSQYRYYTYFLNAMQPYIGSRDVSSPPERHSPRRPGPHAGKSFDRRPP